MGDENRLLDGKTEDKENIREEYEPNYTTFDKLNDINLSDFTEYTEEINENDNEVQTEVHFDDENSPAEEFEILDFETTNVKSPPPPQEKSPLDKRTNSFKKNRIYYVGMFSASLSLVVMGLVFILSLFTVGGVRNALKMSPLILIFLGLELGANWYFRTGKRLRFDIRGYAVSILMILISAGLSFFSVATSNSDRSRENLEKRYERELQNLLIKDLKQTNVDDLKTVNISFSAYDEDISSYSALRDIKDTDILEAQFFFRNSHKTLSDFSSDCAEILELLEGYDLPFGNIDFIADDRLNSVKVSVNAMFDTEISENEIARLAYYFSGDFHNDLEDYETVE